MEILNYVIFNKLAFVDQSVKKLFHFSELQFSTFLFLSFEISSQLPVCCGQFTSIVFQIAT